MYRKTTGLRCRVKGTRKDAKFKRYQYGLRSLMEFFGVSLTTAHKMVATDLKDACVLVRHRYRIDLKKAMEIYQYDSNYIKSVIDERD